MRYSYRCKECGRIFDGPVKSCPLCGSSDFHAERVAGEEVYEISSRKGGEIESTVHGIVPTSLKKELLIEKADKGSLFSMMIILCIVAAIAVLFMYGSGLIAAYFSGGFGIAAIIILILLAILAVAGIAESMGTGKGGNRRRRINIQEADIDEYSDMDV